MLAEKVKKFISANSLINDGDSLLVAFSGGADSMCLLHILKSLSYNVSAAHLNHMLRGTESDNDEHISRDFCKKHNIPFYVFHADISTISKETGVSEETAGREERYKFFDRLSRENSIDKIVTAHNMDDNAETILMHLLRGCGTAGLAGIPIKRGNIVRPLLCCSRSEIEKYCTTHSLPYVTDSSNLKTIYTRNKIRHEIIPLLKKYNTNIISSLYSLSELMSADKIYFKQIIDETIGARTSFDIKELVKMPDSIIYRAISTLSKNAGLSPEFKHIKLIAHFIKSGDTGKKFDVPGGIIEISCGVLSAVKKTSEDFCYNIIPGSEIDLYNFHLTACDNVLSELHFTLPADSEITVRSRRPGDKIRVRGMTKKLSDLFIDKKIPANMRNKIPILSVDGEIIYIFGYEKSDLISNNTKNYKTFVLNISNKEYTNE